MTRCEPPRRRPPLRRWRLLRGIHRRLLWSMATAVLIGVLAGVAGQHFALLGHWKKVGGVTLATLLVLGPLAWMATMRIARPVRELARVAAAMRHGELQRQTELGDSDDEVGEVAEALRGLADRIQGQLADQQALMAAVSHELRSPLGRMRVLIELDREGIGQDGLHDTLQAEIDGMDALVEDLLAASRIDFDALQRRDLDATAVAARALELAEVDASVLRGEAVSVQADATLLTRALRVMLDNARRYGGGVVELAVEPVGDGVRFCVRDDGPGFAEGEAEQVFEPFWRRGPEQGVGLGLALVRRIARAHGGEAGAANREQGGAEVWLTV